MHKTGKTKGKGKGWWEKESTTYNYYWKVNKGKWCENWNSGRACWNVERVDDTTLQMYDKKGKKLSQVWNIIEPAP